MDGNLRVDDAIKFVKKTTGKKFLIMVGQLSPIINDEDNCYSVVGSVVVSKIAAIKFIENAYRSKKIQEIGTVRITDSGNCVFIGIAA